MNQDFLMLYGLIVIMIALSFAFIRRGPRPPVKLKLKADEPAPAKTEQLRMEGAVETPRHTSPGRRPPGWDNYRPRQRPPVEVSAVDADGDTKTDWRVAPSARPAEKSLNIMFNWNGHSWDAYEVLGIPAGSSQDAAHAALQAALQKCDAETVPFLKAAYDAILRK